jgi:hypothetical protein
LPGGRLSVDLNLFIDALVCPLWLM